MTKSSNVSSIIKEAIETASMAQYCRNCSLCYIRENEEYGYCKRSVFGSPVGAPMIVNEYYFCEGWQCKPTSNTKKVN